MNTKKTGKKYIKGKTEKEIKQTSKIDKVFLGELHARMRNLKRLINNREIVFSGTISKSIDDKGCRVFRSKKTGYYHLYVKTDSSKRSAICVINPEIFEKSNIRLKKGGRCRVKKFNITLENSSKPSC